MLLLYLSALSFASASAAAACPAGGHLATNSCFVGFFPHQQLNVTAAQPGEFPTADACCGACAQAGAASCGAWQWVQPAASIVAQRRLCFLFAPGAVPAIKTPKHAAQTQCDMGTAAPPPLPPPPPPSAAIKNVLYILVDDLRTNLSPYGHSDMHTPHLAAFAKSPGTVLFEQAHVQSQMCVPTRNSFMSGRRPDVTRVFNDGVGEKHFRVVGKKWTALPQHFKEQGWFATGCGKVCRILYVCVVCLYLNPMGVCVLWMVRDRMREGV